MPPKVKFTKDEIVHAALNVARAKGLAAVTTRDIAAELSVSTRPIFTYFKSMAEVREAILHAAEKIYQEYLSVGLREPVPFYGFGMQHLHFASDEPQLYRMLFLDSPVGKNRAMNTLDRARGLVHDCVAQNYLLSDEAADRLIRDMLLVVHSLGTLIVTGGCSYTLDEMGAILAGFCLSLCKAYKEIPGFVENDFDRDAMFTQIIHGSGK